MVTEKLNDAVLRDQHLALRETVGLSIPINMVLGVSSFAVAIYSGFQAEGAAWLACSTVVNVLRLLLCRFPFHQSHSAITSRLRLGSDITRANLNAHAFLAFCSGVVWAFVPLLSNWYTTPQTLFYVAVVCGITAGAVTYGYSYSRVPISFIIPPLISSAISLWDPGVFDRYLLAATTVLYLLALARGARVNESLFTNDSRRRNEAIALSDQLELANRKAVRLADESHALARLDQLTGLLNRRGFLEQAESEISKNENLAMFMLDLDGFKSINDAFGHRIGDDTLKEVASRLRSTLGPKCIIARLGGDEFAVLMPTCNEAIIETATQLIDSVSHPLDSASPMKIGLSVGIYVGAISSLDDAFQYADVALYAAKQAGRNQYKIFDQSLLKKIDIRRDIERNFVEALNHGDIQVWYQPVVWARSLQVTSFEALLRWQHDQHGWISPEELILTTASIGRSQDLLSFILNEVASMLATVSPQHDVKIAVNVSPRELAQLDIHSLVLASFESHSVDPAKLEIEITEDVALNHTLVKERLAELTKAGVRIAVDDFGTGYSSLASLQHLNVDRVKIDKSFVTGTTLHSSNSSLVDALLRVSQAYGFDVVAEGVETASDVETMRALGCHYLQGYYFSKALPRDQAIEWMKRNNTLSGSAQAEGEMTL